MEFKRDIYKDLQDWKTRPKRKPLLLMGARQIGKTTTLKAFGEHEFEDFLYLNFEKQQDIHAFFTGNKDPKEILENLSLIHGKKIKEQYTLVIFDEIQECRDALISLKYFAEENPAIHILGAGSLLGLSIGNDRSFPVGKVEFLNMFPLSFSEYLRNVDYKLYSIYCHFLEKGTFEPIPEAFYNALKNEHKEYLLFGTMPEVASEYIQNRNVEKAQKLQDYILQAYVLDFVKNAPKSTSTKIQQVWNSLPSQLAKENRKFIYKLVKSGARAREYEEAIQWLIQAGLVYKVSNVSSPAIPLKAYEDVTSYKLYSFDTGILIRMAGLEPKTFLQSENFFSQFKGALAENYVTQSIFSNFNNPPYYWTSDGKAEVDFVIDRQNICIPIEVKSGTQTKAKSFAVYKNKYKPVWRIRVSNLNLNLTDDLLNVPLFFADDLNLWIEKLLNQ